MEHARTISAHDPPGLVDLAREVNASGEPVQIVEDGEELAVLQPARERSRRRLLGKPTTGDDPLWQLIGIAHSGGPGDVSSDKQKYLYGPEADRGRMTACRTMPPR